MNIAYITKFPSLDVSHWSGIIYYLARGLEKENLVQYIMGLTHEFNVSLRVKNKIFRILEGDRLYYADHSPSVGKIQSKQILQKLSPSAEIVFSSFLNTIAYLKTDKPKVLYTDATQLSLLDYYFIEKGKNTKYLRNILSSRYIKEIIKTERRAFNNADLVILTSEWAAQNAVEEYNICPEKIRITPFGANLEVSYSEEEIHSFIKKRNEEKCKILFIGIEWYRKGGDIAIETARRLNNMGLDLELHFVGITDFPEKDLPPYIINHGKISKASHEGLKTMNHLFSSSHFMFLPTRADCTPVVFSEAMAFGVPCISTKTGGIPTIIRNGVNGYCIDPQSQSVPQSFADTIFAVFKDKQAYEKLALGALQDSRTRLNWDAAVKNMNEAMKLLI